MSTLFLIGNGFDVNCGMKTRYTDVYKGYVKEKSTNSILEKFKKTIESNLETWGDFEMAMAQYAQRLYSEEEFLECVRDFAQYMEKHLLEEQNAFKEKMNNMQIFNEVLNEVENSLGSFYSGISHRVDGTMKKRNATYLGNIEAISFNYTEIFDMLINQYLEISTPLKQKEVVHIHGILQDDPVFGVDNIEQIKASYSLTKKGKRGFIKPVFNTEYDPERVQQARILINNASTICTYGISLGESDLSWRNALIEWLGKNKSNHLFIYQYSLSTVEYRTSSEKMDREDDEKERLLLKWGIDNMENIFDQIHIPCGKNIFNIENVIENVEKELQAEEERKIKERIKKGQEFIESHSQEEATG